VFGNVAVSGSDEVLANWDVLKRIEKNHETVTDSLEGVARSLPGLWRAEKIQKKAAKVGFDWPDVDGALLKLREELEELSDAVKSGGNTKEELGDLLFSAVNVGRFLEIDPEEALQASCEKFILRFRYLEKAALGQGRKLEEMTLEEMDKLYLLAKQELEKKYDA
jgi:tetrapyrrole methylase family protein/MazG family protein